MKRLLSLSVIFFIATTLLWSQGKPKVSRAAYFDKSVALKDVKPYRPDSLHKMWKNGIVPIGKKENMSRYPSNQTADPVVQNTQGKRINRAAPKVFGGIYATQNDEVRTPPDPSGDIGPNHYFQMVNCMFAIYDRDGNCLYGPADNKTLWDGFVGPWTGTNDGDPIVLYDASADKWMASQFAVHVPDSTFWILIAVSATGDPLGEWYRYAYQFDYMPDYPKFGIWPDAYYMSINEFNWYNEGEDVFQGAGAVAFERDKMLTGDPDAQMVYFHVLDLQYGDLAISLLPSDCDGADPVPGEPNYFVNMFDDTFGPVNADMLNIWSFEVDWNNPEQSTFELDDTLHTADFIASTVGTSANFVSQPGTSTKLDLLSERLMFRNQFRNFGTHYSMVVCHSVLLDTATNSAGVRWYELRNYKDGNGWVIDQQGTFAPDSSFRFMGSMAMDGNGNIALGYSVSSESIYPSIRYTGRLNTDPKGVMTFHEMTIKDGVGSQSGISRYGDYSMMSIDPLDDATFWYTTEYVMPDGYWSTKIASFSLEQADNIDLGLAEVVNPKNGPLSDQEEITVLVQNYGIDSVGNVKICYTIDNGEVVTDTIFDTIPPFKSLYHTFKVPADLSVAGAEYDILVYLNNNADMDHDNDTVHTLVKHTYCPVRAMFADYLYVKSVSLDTVMNVSSGSGYASYDTVRLGAEYGKVKNIFVQYEIDTFENPSHELQAWVDWNSNLRFDDDAPVVVTEAGGGYVISFIPPGYVGPGDKRLRIMLKGEKPVTSSCETFRLGEVEDYTLVLSGDPVVNDLYMLAVTSPVSGDSLTSSEPLAIQCHNYGGDTVRSIMYDIYVDDVLVGQGTDNVLLAPAETKTIDLAETVDLSAFGTYNIKVVHTNADDNVDFNDTAKVTVVNVLPEKGDYCVNFDGDNDYIDCGNDEALNLDGAFTIEAWINPAGYGEAGASGYGRVVDKNSVKLFLHNDGYYDQKHSAIAYIAFADGSTRSVPTFINSVQLNHWQHLAMTYNGADTIAVYVNGLLAAMETSETLLPAIKDNSMDNVVIGNQLATDRAFDGQIDEVRIWKRKLSMNEIRNHMCSVGNDTSGLVAYWPLNEGPGSPVIIDRYNKNLDGILQNMNWQESPNTVWKDHVCDVAVYDMSVVEMLSPVSGLELGSSEPVNVVLFNFGADTLTDPVKIEMMVNDTLTVTEYVTDIIPPGSEYLYTFEYKLDMSLIGEYSLTFALTADGVEPNNNDTLRRTVEHTYLHYCTPLNSCFFAQYIDDFVLEDIVDMNTGCSDNGYEDKTAMSTMLNPGKSYTVGVSGGVMQCMISAWVDIDDNYEFSEQEKVINRFSLPLPGEMYYTTVTIPNGLPNGTHRMRVRLSRSAAVDDPCIEDPDEAIDGEIHDYTVEITDVVSKLDYGCDNFNVQVYPNPAKNTIHIDVYNPRYEKVRMTVTDISGKRIMSEELDDSYRNFTAQVDISGLSKGLYFLKFNRGEDFVIRKIVVE